MSALPARKRRVVLVTLVTLVVLVTPHPTAAAPDLRPRFAFADDPASRARAREDTGAARRAAGRRRQGYFLVGLGAAAAAVGTYGYWDANRRPHPDEPLYEGIGNMYAYVLWAVGAGLLARGIWLLAADGDSAGERE